MYENQLQSTVALLSTLGVTSYMVQRAQYNGHKRHHGIKFQNVVAPNGLIISCYGPVDGRRVDPWMLVQSGILDELPNVLDSTGFTVSNICIYMHATSKYGSYSILLCP